MTSQTLFEPGTGSEPTSKIEISISCRNLLDKDVFSRSDPMCVVYAQQMGMNWEEILRTEVVWDNLNPDFVTKLIIDYRFEEEQKLRFEVYDIDSPSSKKLDDHDFLGIAECPLARIVSSGYHGLSLPLSQTQNTNYNVAIVDKKKCKGTIVLVAEELMMLKEEASLQLNGNSIGGGGFLGFCASKVFFTLSKVNETGKFVIVYKSESAPGPNPQWRMLNCSIAKLCGGDHDRGLKIECFKEGTLGYHISLGKISTTVTRLASQMGSDAVHLTNSNGQTLSSRLSVVHFKLSPIYTFLDYIRGGTQLHACFAIDMTGSNGDPSDPSSLHYISPPELNITNPYEQATQAVGEIIQEYNTSKMFPIWGFGARLPNANYLCQGIPDVLDTYRRSIRQVQLWGPTNFSPIIREVASIALKNALNGNYYVLLIITDGIISDMDETKEAIVNASTLPLSIIIVGVGGANFDAMEVLDGDTVRLSSNGRTADRDIVQFVPYRDAHTWLNSVGMKVTGTPSHGNTSRLAKAKLAREVLAEVPEQLTSYMKSRRITPGSGLLPNPGFIPGVL